MLLGVAVLYASDLSRLAELAAGLRPGWLPALALTAPALAAVSVLKWWLLLRARPGGAVPGFTPLLGLYATGQFYNQVLPSNSGGDVVRAEMLTRRLRVRGAGGRSAAWASITAERFTGLAVLVAMAVPAALCPAFWAHPLLMVGIAAGTALSVAVIAGVLLVPPSPPPPAAGPDRRLLRALGKARAKLAAFSADLRSYGRHRRTLAASLALSAGFYALAVASVMVAAACFGHPVAVRPATLATAAVLVVSLLPVSINGLGLWEASFLASFEALGLGGELGLAVALLLRFRDLLWAVAGATVAAACRAGTPATGA
ncbi:hypothetical protein PSMK_04640 [Phycisphaera mikurensis NBRC 102666]|uniref:Flippase-like domain-containing protein n=1 Tax=Phycisphaera mikurensis (strain NBRC 102666 / KCTC 22515 / FYK2301M01) TaxID=1142394 RepID=I0IBI5_PHYMF|nr:hypothetical protein PSMK_04640 [Phycisphaera mikurensis NBRC 102666]